VVCPEAVAVNGRRPDRWLDQEAGPIVRPYAVTRGRTRPHGEQLDLITVVRATGRPAEDRWRMGPEHRGILDLCRRPVSVVEVSSDAGLPLSVVRVLIGDLRDHGLLAVVETERPEDRANVSVLREVLNGLRAL
jgi:hypothetical protein